MTPDLLAYLTAEERAMWERCEHNYDNALLGDLIRDMGSIFTSLAQTRQAVEKLQPYLKHIRVSSWNTSAVGRPCAIQFQQPCDCGLDAARQPMGRDE